ncbi:conserved unknown protein [Ectocarpus siliculosus]|uniref:COP9 signalosome complex subunit 4 n=1 Tax=Ectocarpus siliculosus TaxID=2880 RepID=D7G354_ECTSI|nr:conserved unknown protein [Ectocarpus siliculosus]|eukprot:CBJ26901.1 conserved unknown protein [Ectocarpus siliculosus]
MAAVEAKLASISGIGDQRERTARYKALGEELAAGGRIDDVQAMFRHLLGSGVPPVVSRQCCAHLAKEACSFADTNPEGFEALCHFCLEKMQEQPGVHDSSEYVLRHRLFEELLKKEEFMEAANCLGKLNLDATGGGKGYTDAQKAEVWVKVAEAYLESDETDAADNFCSKASATMQEVTDWALQMRYRTTAARILDAHRKFLDASVRFYELSLAQSKGLEVDPDDLLQLLGKAITCAVLGKAGPQRSRQMGVLLRDERVGSLARVPGFSTHSQVLTKMYTEQILRKHDMEAFEESLMDHQKAITAEGLPIPERAVMEHNMVASTRIYENVSFKELGTLLQIPCEQAERVAARMITEGRLRGTIDQVEGLLQFEGDHDELQNWDERVNILCQKVNNCCETIGNRFPHVLEPAAASPAADAPSASAASPQLVA